MKNFYIPDIAIYPGTTVREILICKLLGEDFHNDDLIEFVDFLDDVVQGKQSPITSKWAMLLEKYTGMKSNFWLNLQHNYNVMCAKGVEKQK
jgi:plasmid maintenance system antidote protein VapI